MTDHITEASRVGRIPVVFVELDMDCCTRTYGSSPCTASVGVSGAAKCYNTYATCQDTAHYNKGVKTYRFSDPSARLPVGLQTIPLLKSVSFAAQQITPGKGLGVRGSVTIRFSDAPWTDIDIDPYASSRATPAAGTFWGRFRARNPYYEGRMMRIISGYITKPFTWDAFETRAYIIDSLSAIMRGDEAQIVGKDILKLADDKKALFPAPSTGKLSASLSSGATSFSVSPSGIGSSYPASGKVAIGGEVMAFTRSGDAFTVTRASSGTDAKAHDADDTVQLVGVYTSEEIHTVIYDLLTTYAGIDSSYIDLAAWNTERDTYLTGVWSTEITEPTGVNTLLGEITEQGNCRIWWDEIGQQIRFRAIKPVPDDAPIYTDDLHFLSQSVSVTEDAKQRISSVLIYFGRLKPTEKLDDLKNYAIRYLDVDADATSPNQYGNNQIKKIFSRWFLSSSLGRVQDLATALLLTYRDPPRIMEFRLDPRNGLKTGDIFRASTRFLQGVDGQPLLSGFEVIEAQEEKTGSVMRYKAQEVSRYIPLASTYTIIISTDTNDIDLYALFVAEYGTPISGITVVFTINSGVLVSSSSTSTPALINPTTWPSGCNLTLINAGIISGRGGDGGVGGGVYDTGGGGAACTSPAAGDDGGLGMEVDYPLSVDNTSGVIMGGNPGGGGGGAVTLQAFGGPQRAGGSGGGAGWPYGVGGLGGISASGLNDHNGYDGVSAVRSPAFGTVNDGGATVYTGSGSAIGGQGGYGSNHVGPNVGGDGDDGYLAGPGSTSLGAASGAIGDCLHGDGNVTWIATGLRYGTIT